MVGRGAAGVAAGDGPRAERAPRSDLDLFEPVRDLGRDWTRYLDVVDAKRLEQELAAPMALLGYRPIAA